ATFFVGAIHVAPCRQSISLNPGRDIMNRRSSILSLYALVLCVGTMTTSSAMAQPKSLKEQLIGIWTFASSIDTNKDGSKSNRWGPNAKGQLMLDPSGRFSFMISRA